MVTRSRLKRSSSSKKPTRLERPKYNFWFIVRGGNFSAQEALQDVLARFAIDNYDTRPSFLMFEKRFNNKQEAKKFEATVSKELWNYAWYKQADCGVSGVQEWDEDLKKYLDIEDD